MSQVIPAGQKMVERRKEPVQCGIWQVNDVVFSDERCLYFRRLSDLLWLHPFCNRMDARSQRGLPGPFRAWAIHIAPWYS